MHEKREISGFKCWFHVVAIVFILNPLLPILAQNTCKEVIGYYPSWQWYDRGKLVGPSSIQYEKYSIINYAFLDPQSDGSLMITDPWADKNLLLGEFDWSVAPAGYDSKMDLGDPAYHKPKTSLVYRAHEQGTKVLISIGGWTLSNNFPAIAADTTKRTRFAHACNEVVRLYGIDGIDLDWEYPGYAPHNGSSKDKALFTALIREVRDSLDALESELGRQFLFTAAFGAARDHMGNIEWNKVVPELDYINLMSYDFFGAFSTETNHNSPLYAPQRGDSTFNIDSAVTHLLRYYKVPATKLNVGVAFYGRSAKTKGGPGLHAATTGSADQSTFAVDDGSPLYYNLLLKKHLFDEAWDSSAQVPYLLGKSGLNTFVSYDDPRSIRLKAQYVRAHGLAGTIIWELTGDYIESPNTPGRIEATPLLDTLNHCLCFTEDPTERIMLFDTVCQTYRSPSGKWLDSTGVYLDTVRRANGPNRIYTIYLTRNRPGFDSLHVRSCMSYTSPSGRTYTESGVFLDTITNHSGCDSIIHIDLSIDQNISDTIRVKNCGPYWFAGRELTSSGTYTDSLLSQWGCDSVVVLHLKVKTPGRDSSHIVSCGPYRTAGGRILNSPGRYTDTVRLAGQCDSFVNIRLEITEIDTGIIQLENQLVAVERDATYQWLDCDRDFSILEGETSRDLKPNGHGNFAVEITKRECRDTSACYETGTIGIRGLEPQFRIYPNPGTGSYFVELHSSQIANLVVYNDLGRIIYEGTVYRGLTALRLNVAPGIYPVELRIGHKSHRFRLIHY
ncbi:MAG: T9SS type A sorting domain-containing protein [Flavobacteriales bacterium]|nr:T9SS type A sorting domain-containing protein [Flavobacteriales bacterium]